MKTIIKKCVCSHEYQDRRYGKGMRVMNVKSKKEEATCTVCGTTYNTFKG